MPTIFFDESGNTGANHLDNGQPIYVLSSLNIGVETADELLSRHFGDLLAGGIKDLKYSRLSGTNSGRKAIMSFLKEIHGQPQVLKSYIVLKKFALVAKYVDWLVEPATLASGLDIYEDGGKEAKGLANFLWFFAPHALTEAKWNALLVDFQNWSTGMLPTEDLRSHVMALKVDARFEEVGQALRSPFLSAHPVTVPDGSDYRMDVSFTSAYALVRAWMDDGVKDIGIVHDRSKVMEAQEGRWAELADPTLNASLFSSIPGDWPPLEVSSVRFGDQYSDPALQLADIVAGANRASANHIIGLKTEPFAQTMVTELKLPNQTSGMVFPERLTTGE